MLTTGMCLKALRLIIKTYGVTELRYSNLKSNCSLVVSIFVALIGYKTGYAYRYIGISTVMYHHTEWPT